MAETKPTHALTTPRYDGASLPNLVATLEERLVGSSPHKTLEPGIADLIPHGETYVLVIIDGLGVHQLDHPDATDIRSDRVATLDAPFPTTTTVSLACIATAQPPSQHGLLAYTLHLPEHEMVVNTIRWTTLWGEATKLDTNDFLPAPNTWERLKAGGVEAITVQPANFERSSLTRLLYRGCRFEPAHSEQEIVDATVELAAQPGRLIVTYIPHVDFAAHLYGQQHEKYADALSTASTIWSQLAARLPGTVTLVGTADHGHVDFAREKRFKIDRADHEGRVLFGDSRVMMVKGDGAAMAEGLPATWVPIDEMVHVWGPTPHHASFAERIPDGALVAEDGWVLLHRHANDKMLGNHGGTTPEEMHIPLLVRRAR